MKIILSILYLLTLVKTPGIFGLISFLHINRDVIVPVQQWSTEMANSTSMMTELVSGTSELSGSTLRLRADRIKRLDYVMPIWPFV